jgi:hypothetical protein
MRPLIRELFAADWEDYREGAVPFGETKVL